MKDHMNLPFLSPGEISSPRYTRGILTFNKACEGALINVTLSGWSVPECRWSWPNSRNTVQLTAWSRNNFTRETIYSLKL